MKYTFILIFLCLGLNACNSKQGSGSTEKKVYTNKNDSVNKNIAIKEIPFTTTLYSLNTVDSLSFLHLYSKAKWYLYCFNCDKELAKTYKTFDSSCRNRTLGEFALKFDYAILSDSLITFYFKYIFDKCTVDTQSQIGFYANSLTIKIINDSVYSFADSRTQVATTFGGNPNSRLNNPLQREVISYIKTHSNTIDIWFKKEAVLRGVIIE